MAHILVIDDEPGILRFVSRALSSDGHDVTVAYDGPSALQLVARRRPDLVILDLLLPGINGNTVLTALLTHDLTLRVLILSAVGDPHARVRCLEAGAVDFLSKPFVVAELIARVRSRLREPRPIFVDDDALSAGRIRLDRHLRRAEVNGRHVDLSTREFLVLEHLMRRAGSVCSRQELLSEVWGYDFDPGSNVVDACIARLRAKLRCSEIETVRNVGYCIQPA
jgi:DNA-binding response OmpR family regulator